MNNIIKSQRLICKKNIIWIAELLLITLFFSFVNVFSEEGISGLSLQTLAGGSFIPIVLMGFIPTLVIGFSYTQRIQMYEIMAGFRPHQIMLGKAAVYLPITVAYLAVVTAVYLIADSSTDMIRLLILFWMLCLRFTLCVIFLSPLLKEQIFMPMFSITVLMAMPIYVEIDGSLEGFSHSVFSFTCFGQCGLLGGGVTYSFMAKVIISSVIACVVYYLIGYLTLKKKIDLEPHPLK